MGVSTNIYAVHGAKIPWHSAFMEAYDEIYDSCDIDVIPDGMGGEYIVLGTKLFDSGDFRWGLEDGDSYKEIDLTTLDELESKYKERFKVLFPNFLDIIAQPFKIIMFTHYH